MILVVFRDFIEGYDVTVGESSGGRLIGSPHCDTNIRGVENPGPPFFQKIVQFLLKYARIS